MIIYVYGGLADHIWFIFLTFNHRNTVGYKVPLNTDLGADAKKVQKEEQRKIDEAEELTEEEQAEKDELLKDGFGNWTKRDFNQFIRSGRRDGEKRSSIHSSFYLYFHVFIISFIHSLYNAIIHL